MSGKKKLVRGGLASVFGGIEQKTISENDAIKDNSSQPSPISLATTETDTGAILATESAPEALTKEELPSKNIASTVKPHSEAPSSARLPDAQNDPYEHVRRVKWPILEPGDPYLIPGPQGFENLNATVNFRLPANLDATLDAHCRSVGARKSAWIREAILKFLAEEQLALQRSHPKE